MPAIPDGCEQRIEDSIHLPLTTVRPKSLHPFRNLKAFFLAHPFAPAPLWHDDATAVTVFGQICKLSQSSSAAVSGFPSSNTRALGVAGCSQSAAKRAKSGPAGCERN
jgi:hypothetical protein